MRATSLPSGDASTHVSAAPRCVQRSCAISLSCPRRIARRPVISNDWGTPASCGGGVSGGARTAQAESSRSAAAAARRRIIAAPECAGGSVVLLDYREEGLVVGVFRQRRAPDLLRLVVLPALPEYLAQVRGDFRIGPRAV